MMTARHTQNGFVKKIMDLIPVAMLMLLGWICLSIIQLKTGVAEMQKDITSLLAAKNIQDTANIGNNSRRLKELEAAGPGQGGVPVVAAPVTVVNPPDKPVPVETARRGDE